jgi:cytochrome c-type biogenesis protein CcmH/NrfG
MMVFGFNRPEAVRSFRRAAELDPKAAMPHWGMALALGRHLNMEGDMDVQAQAAFQAIGQALALSGSASPVEQAYIQALVKRCAANPQADGQGLDQAYSEAMGELVQQYPDDPDAAALYAESLMNQHRYAWYSAEGNPTQEAQLI